MCILVIVKRKESAGTLSLKVIINLIPDGLNLCNQSNCNYLRAFTKVQLK